jgi:hypothetical protein
MAENPKLKKVRKYKIDMRYVLLFKISALLVPKIGIKTEFATNVSLFYANHINLDAF